MKKPIILFIVLAALLVLTTCEKDKDKETRCRVTVMKLKSGNEVDSIMYFYDDKGRLIKTEIQEGWYTLYQHETNKVTEISFIDGAHSYTNVYTLDFDGYAITSTYTLAGNSEPESSTTYDFDEDGYLLSTTEVSAIDHDDITTISYDYEDGNQVYREHVRSTSSYYSETEYDFYPDKTNKFNNLFPYKGKENTNLIKKTTYTSGSINLVTTYSYDINKAGYVIKEIQNTSTVVFEKEYIYDCD